MKTVNLTVYVPDDLEVNDITVGRALGEAIMTDTLRYEEAADVTNDKDYQLKKKAIVDYCYPYLDKMWASHIVGIILICDFRDAKQYANKFFDYCKENGIE
jgi:hypothetical protein